MLRARDRRRNRRICIEKDLRSESGWAKSFGRTIAISGRRDRPHYPPTLIVGIAASVGIVVGSIAPWLRVFVISANGLDIDGWGNATLTLGGGSGIALVSQWDSVRTISGIRWAVPLACGVFVGGVACLALAVIDIIRFMSISSEVFGETVDVHIGWGLWLVALSSAVLCAAMATMAFLGKASTEGNKSSHSTWTAVWVWAAVIASTVIVLSAITYVRARQMTGYDHSFWFRLFEQYLA
jgi:hypothetical protein